MKWSVRDLLLFSQAPGIMEALDGYTNVGMYVNSEDGAGSGESSISDDGG